MVFRCFAKYVLFEMNLDFLQVVEEMESANNILRQKLEKYENEKVRRELKLEINPRFE